MSILFYEEDKKDLVSEKLEKYFHTLNYLLGKR